MRGLGDCDEVFFLCFALKYTREPILALTAFLWCFMRYLGWDGMDISYRHDADISYCAAGSLFVISTGDITMAAGICWWHGHCKFGLLYTGYFALP
jgi:hypothetical protein